MYIELTRIRISYGQITYIHGKVHVTVVWMILIFEIIKLSHIKNVMLWSYYMLS
jgi:hypothetical protein